MEAGQALSQRVPFRCHKVRKLLWGTFAGPAVRAEPTLGRHLPGKGCWVGQGNRKRKLEAIWEEALKCHSWVSLQIDGIVRAVAPAAYCSYRIYNLQ